MAAPFLIMADISKQYPGVKALQGVSFAVAPGEIIGLVGENGAGKSTLMKILGGVVEPSSGTLEIDGEQVSRLSINASMRAGIAFVHQELNLFDNLTVAANIFIGREPVRGRFLRLVDEDALKRQTDPLLAQLGADFEPDAPVASLSLAQRQLVEIAKALSLNARLVIMDEPTSSLTATETVRLLDVIRKLKAQGVSVIFITHRLAEVERIADRVVVLRDGRTVAELHGGDIQSASMIRYMIGRDLKALYRPPSVPAGTPLIELDGVITRHRPSEKVSFAVRRGEILGLAGLVGSGRTELARTIFGLDPRLDGEIRVNGRKAAIACPRDAIDLGIYLVPEDRKRCGLILDLTIRENITLTDVPVLSRLGLVDEKREDLVAWAQMAKLDIRAHELPGKSRQSVRRQPTESGAGQVAFDEPHRAYLRRADARHRRWSQE